MDHSLATVWVVDDDASIRFVLEKSFRHAGINAKCFESAEHLLRSLPAQSADVLFTDVRMPGMDGLALTEKLRAQYPTMPVIVMSALADLTSTVAAFDVGAFDFLAKPFDIDTAIALAQRALQLRYAVSETATLESAGSELIVGKSAAIQGIFRAIGRLSKGSLSVLITGETGTGKELVARALHQHSPRAAGPFVALNTAAIAPELLESELFGHEAGAFTGAQKRHVGRFEQAHGGTLFLDEIGDMPATLQAKLLRVLAEGEFYPLGSRELKRTDVRILTATHRDLQNSVAEGSFRADLLHRLNVVQLHLPPLRERQIDIPFLIERFLQEAGADNTPKRISENALQALMQQAWPGNVRELRNVCLRLAALAPGDCINVEDLDLASEIAPKEIGQSGDSLVWLPGLRSDALSRLQNGHHAVFDQLFAEFEQAVLETALQFASGERQLAAKLLGVGRNSFSRKLKKSDAKS